LIWETSKKKVFVSKNNVLRYNPLPLCLGIADCKVKMFTKEENTLMPTSFLKNYIRKIGKSRGLQFIALFRYW